MADVSFREFMLWRRIFSQEMNEPSRTDYYVMQATAEFVRSRVKNPSSIRVESFVIPFGRKIEDETDRLLPSPGATSIAASYHGRNKGVTVERISRAEHQRRIAEQQSSSGVTS